MTAYKYSELTGKIIGCAMKVHSALGNGFQEVIYQRALEIEMLIENIPLKENSKCLFIIETIILVKGGLIFG